MVHFINQIIYNIQTLGFDFIKSSIVSQIHPCPLNRYLGHGRIFGASLPVSEFPLMLFQKWNLQIIFHENENQTNWPLSSLFLKYPLMSATPARTRTHSSPPGALWPGPPSLDLQASWPHHTPLSSASWTEKVLLWWNEIKTFFEKKILLNVSEMRYHKTLITNTAKQVLGNC